MMDKREAARLFSEELRKFWNGWEIRVLVILSLLLQIMLIIFGPWRKFTRRIWIRILVWLAYMSADWVATVSLGNLATNQGDSGNNSSKLSNREIQAFWAPFLLLHLGGPDTITAYALEDNELWLRHLLGLVVQVGVAFYVFFWSWSMTALSFISIPIFTAGFIKYGERTFVLRSSSSKQFKEDLVSTNAYAKNVMRLMKALEEEAFFEGDISIEKPGKNFVDLFSSRKNVRHLIEEADFLFKRFKYLFANLILGLSEQIDCYNIMCQKSAKDAFELVAIELGFMYDVLYTKATIAYTRLGIFLRSISFFSSASALVVFSVIIDKHAYPKVDISITWLLLVGAVFLEVYAFIILLISDWTKLWLVKHWNKFIPPNNNGRWSESVVQCNLISFCLKDTKPVVRLLRKFPLVSEFLDFWYLTSKVVDADMQDLIFKQLQEKSEKIKGNHEIKSCKELLAMRGYYVLGKKYLVDEHDWSTIEVDFDHSLLVWHIATDICYYKDFENTHEQWIPQKCKISRLLSNYMLYLLIQRSTMMPNGIGEIRYRDTYDQVKKFFEQYTADPNKIINEKEFCKELYEEKSLRPIDQSVLPHGRELAMKLQSLVSDRERQHWDNDKKWTMISEVWVEMLAYASNQCTWKEHAQQLRRGGELLTHVRLLMAHLGLTKNTSEEELFFILSSL